MTGVHDYTEKELFQITMKDMNKEKLLCSHLREGRSLVISMCFVEHMGIYLFLSGERLVLIFEGVTDLIIILSNDGICTL